MIQTRAFRLGTKTFARNCRGLQFFSTDSNGKDGEKNGINNDNNRLSDAFEKHKKEIMWSAGLTGGAVTVYGISTFLYSITSTLMTLTPLASMYYGFMSGCITAGIGSSLFMNSGRLVSIHPDNAWNAALTIINNDHSVNEVLGRRTVVGSDVIKGFRHYAGGLTVRNSKPTWVQPTVELLVKLSGEKSSGFAAIRATTVNMKVHIEYLAIHFDDDITNSHSMLLVGDKIDTLKESMIRGFTLQK